MQKIIAFVIGLALAFAAHSQVNNPYPYFRPGTAASPGFYVVGDRDTGLYSTGANNVSIATSGVSQLEVNANASTFRQPLNIVDADDENSFLFIQGTGATRFASIILAPVNITGATGSFATAGTATANTNTGNVPNSSALTHTGAAPLYLNATNAAGSIKFATGGNAFANERGEFQADGDFAVDTNTLFVDATNNRVGIGTVPSLPLHLSTSVAAMGVFDTTNASGGYTTWGTSLTLRGYVGTGSSVFVGGAITDFGIASENDLLFATTGGAVRGEFEADGDFAVDTNTLFVDAANNRVGIGDATPDTTLDVAGTIEQPDSSAYLWTLEGLSTTGTYWDTTNNQIVYRDAGTDRYSFDFDSGNIKMTNGARLQFGERSIIDTPAVDASNWYTNYNIFTNASFDTAKPSWLISLGTGDGISFYRAPATVGAPAFALPFAFATVGFYIDNNTAANTPIIVSETGIDKSSAGAETYNIQNSGAGAMTLQVDGVTIRPVVNATATYNPASLAAATTRTDTVTVTGITTTGGAVSANPGTAFSTSCVIASVRASAANSVEITLRNTIDAVTACDEPSSTWTFSQAQ